MGIAGSTTVTVTNAVLTQIAVGRPASRWGWARAASHGDGDSRRELA